MNAEHIPPSVDLQRIQQLAFSTFGLDLRHGKEELIMARIGKVMRRQNLSSLKDYYAYVTGDSSGEALVEMVEALTTNFTGFFREMAHFDLLNKAILPGLKTKPTIVRIWSAACSSGEEPYSIAFCLHDAGLDESSAIVVASDISRKMLSEGSAAVYKHEELTTMSAQQRQRYFLAGVGPNLGAFKIKPEIRRMVQFAVQNLVAPIEIAQSFDVIFCRNVMIYFDKVTQQEVIRGLERKLLPGGYLLIGHSETLNNLQHSLRYVSPAVYRAGGS